MTFIQTVNEFRQRLLSREETAVNQINDLWVPVYRQLIAEFNILFNQVDTLLSAGKKVTDLQLYTTTRLAFSIRTLSEELQNFNGSATILITNQLENELKFAFSDGADLIRSSMGRIPPKLTNFNQEFLSFDNFALQAITERVANAERIARILQVSYDEAIIAAQVYVRAIVTGAHARTASQELQRKFNIPKVRADTTARTEIVSAYRDGNLERYRGSEVVKAWEWSATLDDRTCPVCIYMDGQVFSLETLFATHPNCRCAPVPVTKTFAELGIIYSDEKPYRGKRGQDWFNSLPESRQEQILHPAKFKLYKSGQITLKDLVHEYDHINYGPSRDERSIKRLRELRIIK